MDKVYTNHYIVATYGNTSAAGYRKNAMAELIHRYDYLTGRIIHALESNGVDNPSKHISYAFQMLGDHHDDSFNRKEMVKVDLEALKENPESFQWEQFGWVQVFQPVVQLAGFAIIEIDSEYQSFGPEPTPEVDFVQPCFRIHEQGPNGHKPGSKDNAHDKPSGEEAPGFYEEVILPCAQVLKENAPTLIALGSAIATFTLMWNATQQMTHDLEEKTAANNDVLHHIEDLMEDAIEMPQVVKVEFPDDSEVIGYGRKTW